MNDVTMGWISGHVRMEGVQSLVLKILYMKIYFKKQYEV
jgi:hypothetical protein